MIPIRCFSCGRPIGHLYEKFLELSKKMSKKEALDKVGLKKYCCRQVFLTHVELIDQTAVYKKF